MLKYDVVIVGARCAGASLAIYLARTGASVLLLDKDKLPSDQVLSTHTIHPPGIDILDELGVGTALREVTPPVRVMRFTKNNSPLDLRFPEGRAEYCPRRKRLDGLLQEAAQRAGVELLDQTRAASLLWENGRVAGVRAMRNHAETLFRAELVVGADGRHSTVAQLAGAEEYLGYDSPRGMYWGYWEAPAFWRTDAAYGFDWYIGKNYGKIHVIFPTDHNQLLIGSLPPVNELDEWRGDALGTLRADLSTNPVMEPLVQCQPDGKIRATLRERYFFRNGTGPGWALVGDAGHHKEFAIGDGITEALLQARSLARAISTGKEASLERWWRARDLEALPYYFLGKDEGAAGPAPELESMIFSKIAQSPQLQARFIQVMEHQLSSYEAVPLPTVLQCLAAAALRGKFQVFPEFARMVKRSLEVTREMKKRSASGPNDAHHPAY